MKKKFLALALATILLFTLSGFSLAQSVTNDSGYYASTNDQSKSGILCECGNGFMFRMELNCGCHPPMVGWRCLFCGIHWA